MDDDEMRKIASRAAVDQFVSALDDFMDHIYTNGKTMGLSDELLGIAIEVLLSMHMEAAIKRHHKKEACK